jgi:hypothetical protein
MTSWPSDARFGLSFFGVHDQLAITARRVLAALIASIDHGDMMTAFLVGAAAGTSPTRLITGSGSNFASSTCFGHFATACSLATTYTIVDELVAELALYSSPDVLANVTLGAYNTKEVNFWPTIYNASSSVVASGRQNTDNASRAFVDGAALLGLTAEEVAEAEAGFPQPGLWERMVAAADGDGLFQFVGFDNYHTAVLSEYAPPFAVPRIGYARWAGSASGANGTLLVASACSGKAFRDNIVQQVRGPSG